MLGRECASGCVGGGRKVRVGRVWQLGLAIITHQQHKDAGMLLVPLAGIRVGAGGLSSVTRHKMGAIYHGPGNELLRP